MASGKCRTKMTNQLKGDDIKQQEIPFHHHHWTSGGEEPKSKPKRRRTACSRQRDPRADEEEAERRGGQQWNGRKGRNGRWVSWKSVADHSWRSEGLLLPPSNAQLAHICQRRQIWSNAQLASRKLTTKAALTPNPSKHLFPSSNRLNNRRVSSLTTSRYEY